MKIAVYPGTFDPITYGHVDIVQRASAMVDELVIAVASNSAKNPCIPLADRVKLVQAVFCNCPSIRVEAMTGLLVDFARQLAATVIIRGIRGTADIQHELSLAQVNRQLDPSIETVLLPALAEKRVVSSRLVRELVNLGGDITAFVPAPVQQYFHK